MEIINIKLKDKDGNSICTSAKGSKTIEDSNKIVFNFQPESSINLKKNEQYSISYVEELSRKPSSNVIVTYIKKEGENLRFKKGSEIDSKQKHISNFGIIGYGINTLENEPTSSIIDFTFNNEQSFKWNNENISIPDQIDFNETPTGQSVKGTFSSKIITSREYQLDMMSKLGLSAKDPETCLTFKGNADLTNNFFSNKSGDLAIELYTNRVDISFLELIKINYSKFLNEEVKEAIKSCGGYLDKIIDFYKTYGTHVIKSAHIGGQMNMKTTVRIDHKTNKEISKNKIDITANVKAENNDHINGSVNFDKRNEGTSKLFRDISEKQISLIGGNVSTKDEETWRQSLLNSKIPLRGESISDSVSQKGDSDNTNLGLVGIQYTEIYNVLDLDPTQKEAFEKAFDKYMNGINPFDNTPQRLKPRMDYDNPIYVASPNRKTFKMRGWGATYVTSAGLYGKPGSWAIVRCKSDAEPGGWDEKTIYAGEKVELRGKTAYMSGLMYIEVVSSGKDNDAVIYTENTLVSW
ncbi:MAC/perforin domain-containing protein [Abyssalbus ytuae]|uniref:MAC/perforin domain-containing protein n=1 Tax=Abyssalbus ytuae TaxID=2926907 RepID=A0A9E6ZPU1_9FLAO|nr:MAC/perforin domain-containing protein [Abyssalbus ytuae]UOB18330.1 MAC/perforin domain-containing protein [Abyssalbus ytuae]